VAGLAVFVLLCASLPYMSICAGVVVSVPFHEVHNAPNTKARADGNNESLQNGNSLIEEFHSRFSPDCSIDKKYDSKRKTGWHIFGAACFLQFWLLLSFS
jgi:hypothetical protein